MLCPRSFIVQTIHIETQMQSLDIYSGGAYIRKDIGASSQGSLHSGIYGTF